MPLIDYSFWDNYKNTIEAMTGGTNTVEFDDLKLPSVMVRLASFNLEDIDANLGAGLHPAFLYDTTVQKILIGKYLACIPSGGTRCYSLPGNTTRLAANSITYDQAVSYCTSKGAGWHLMTAHEWGAVALGCCKRGVFPRGNTEYGRAHDARHETARREDGAAPGGAPGTPRTLPGSGPETWTHNQSPSGIHDLVGNIWEWNHLLKLVDGRFVCPDTNKYDSTEASWTLQNAYVDSPVTGDMAGSDDLGVPSLADSVTHYAGTAGNDGYYDYNSISPWRSMVNSLTVTPSVLKALLVAPANTITGSIAGYFYCRNYGTRLPVRGGYWGGTSLAGLGALSLGGARSYANTNFGFRPALVKT